jgi:hypothetical protein
MRTADWRVSVAPELRASRLAEKTDIPARAVRVAGLHEDPDMVAEVRNAALTRIASERSLMNRIGAGEAARQLVLTGRVEWMNSSVRLAHCARVNDEAVPYVGGQYALVGVVNFLGRDDFDLGSELVFGAEVEHVLGLADTADH